MSNLDQQEISRPKQADSETFAAGIHLQPEAAPSRVKPPPEGKGSAPWVPVRSMTRRHRPRILQHLHALDERDRYLRFGYPATDEQIARYVEALDFDRDELFGIFNRKLELLALAHLAYAPRPVADDKPSMAEFGVSVLPKARRRQFGARLFDNAILHARNRGFDTLFIHALSENTAMLRIARKAGAEVIRDGSETEAWLKLPQETVSSRFDEVVGQQAAEFDYQWKLGAKRIHDALGALAEVGVPFVGKDPADGQ
ncbi:MAG: GNAT family N-acetyltransferase [Ideonella sp.]